MLRVLLLFSVFLLVNGQAGEVTTNVTYSGTPAACSNICNETIYMAEMACNNDTASWGNGTKEFLDPVPAGNIVYNISAILNFNFGCTNITSTDGFATIDGELIDFLPQLTDSADCSCSNCMQNITLSKNYPDGWPNYVYGGLNTFKLWYKPFICLSLVTLNIGYDISQPKLTSYHPTAIPTSTAATIFVSGEDFLPSNILFCNFGGELTNATYVNANQITCPAFVSDTANSTEFQLVDSRQNILDGGEFTWYIQPTVLSMDPTSSMSTVSTNVTLTGSNFFNSSSAVCKFGNIPFFDIDFISDTTVVCLNIKDVQSDPRNVSVSFSENGFNYVTTSLTYEFTGTNFPNTSPTVSVSPSASPSEVSQNPAVPPFVWAAIGILVLICCILMIGGSSIAYQNKKKKAYSNVFGDDLLPPAHEPSRTISNALASDPNIIPFSELTGLKQIEKGSFGVIYEASWRGIQIAVKKLPATMTEKQLTEFRQEAALMKSLRHPNILQYLGISQTNDRAPCICMEYMPLGSLYRILHMPNSDFDRSRIRSVCLDTCRGMNYLHQQHPPIIHRDLKSHNLLVDRHWQVKVCDFGLSRITEQNQTMTACGTPSWTAPEVLRNERYTTKADVYGFGIVIWEMFARADPFPEMPPFQIVFAVGTQKLRPRIDQSWPEEWINLMTSCWNEDQQARPTFETLITIIEGLPDPR